MSHDQNNASDYWNIDDILAEDERITSKFQVSAVRLGFLDSSSPTEDLQEASKVDLPLWLVRRLRENQMVSVRVPMYLLAQSRSHMKANAVGADIRAASPYYYEVAQRVAEMTGKEGEISETLMKILSERFFSILDNAQSGRDEDVSDYVQKLTVFETDLYHVASSSAKEMSKWKRRESEKIECISKRCRMW